MSSPASTASAANLAHGLISGCTHAPTTAPMEKPDAALSLLSVPRTIAKTRPHTNPRIMPPAIAWVRQLLSDIAPDIHAGAPLRRIVSRQLGQPCLLPDTPRTRIRYARSPLPCEGPASGRGSGKCHGSGRVPTMRYVQLSLDVFRTWWAFGTPARQPAASPGPRWCSPSFSTTVTAPASTYRNSSSCSCQCRSDEREPGSRVSAYAPN